MMLRFKLISVLNEGNIVITFIAASSFNDFNKLLKIKIY